MRRVVAKFLLCLVLLTLGTSILLAQTAPPADRVAQLEAKIADAKNSADNAWMLVCSALVLMMTGPGLALFYGGLVRKKNVLGTMMQSFAMMAVITVLWALFSYSLAFGAGTASSAAFTTSSCTAWALRPIADYAATIPAADLHDLPVDVRHHHAGADHRARLPSA